LDPEIFKENLSVFKSRILLLDKNRQVHTQQPCET